MKTLTLNGKTYEVVDGNAIPCPVKATIGQTIVVKTVDEFGRPIEWEAIDFSGKDGIDEKYIVQDIAPDDTSVLWVDTSDDTSDFKEIFIDTSLSISGYAADAKAAGDALDDVVKTASSLVFTHNNATDAHNDIREQLAQVYNDVRIHISDIAPADAIDGMVWIDISEE